MKFILALIAVLATVGLGQAYTLQNYEQDSFEYSIEDNDQGMMDFIYGAFIPEEFDDNERTVGDELRDFVKLIPKQKAIEIMKEYWRKDRDVRSGIVYLLTIEFHTLLRKVEALKEHQALVVFIQKAGLDIIGGIKRMHRAIGMEDYVPPKMEIDDESEFGVQKIGGMRGLTEALIAILPTDDIEALYNEKMKIQMFADFVEKITSEECRQLARNLISHKTFKKMMIKSLNQGLDFKAIARLLHKIVPIRSPNMFDE